METVITILGWLGTLCIFLGLYGVTQKRRGAFLFSVAGETAWLVKSFHLHAWDLAVMTLAFIGLAGYGFWKWGAEARHEAEQTKVRVKQAQDAAHARHIQSLLDMPCKIKDMTPTQRETYLEYINHERAALGQPPL